MFIHPGGFYVGTGDSNHAGPDYLLEKNVVLVTFNYRLAFFGFTSTGNKDAPGNAGLKDQVLVLKWIREHISYFGGDPNSVTLMGNSAGAVSVALHMVSPATRGLFHRAIISSGAILPQAKQPQDQIYLVEKLTNLLNCTLGDSYRCIKNGSVTDITESLRKIFEFGWDNPVYPWLPIIEPHIDGEEPFLTANPLNAFQRGHFQKVPILISTTKDELGASALYLFKHPELLQMWVNSFPTVGPICLQYERNTSYSRYVSDELWQHYVNGTISFQRTARLFSDGLVNFPVFRLAEMAKDYTNVFYYLFSYRGRFSNLKCDRMEDDTDLCTGEIL